MCDLRDGECALRYLGNPDRLWHSWYHTAKMNNGIYVVCSMLIKNSLANSYIHGVILSHVQFLNGRLSYWQTLKCTVHYYKTINGRHPFNGEHYINGSLCINGEHIYIVIGIILMAVYTLLADFSLMAG